MKKVELITLQQVPNYGSVLQAYATQKTIEKLGYECEIIKYVPRRVTKIGMLESIKRKNEKFEKSLLARTAARIIIFPSYILRFKMFRQFRKKYLNETKKTYRNYDDLLRDVPLADIYCTGSDQVWNSGWNGEIDKAMFLGFVPGNRPKIAYAASFGKKELEEDEKQITREMLKQYLAISVRENTGVDILRSLGLDGKNVLDPTLLLSGDEWREMASKRFKNKKKYVLVYNLNRNNKIDKYAQKLAKKSGLEVKYVSYQLHEKYKKGKVYCDIPVEDFLSLIDNATCVVTDSFHATAFSINLNTDFRIVLPGKYSTRLRSILEHLELEDRIVDKGIKMEKINFDVVNSKLNEMRAESVEWLKDALGGCK